MIQKKSHDPSPLRFNTWFYQNDLVLYPPPQKCRIYMSYSIFQVWNNRTRRTCRFLKNIGKFVFLEQFHEKFIFLGKLTTYIRGVGRKSILSPSPETEVWGRQEEGAHVPSKCAPREGVGGQNRLYPLMSVEKFPTISQFCMTLGWKLNFSYF